MRVEAEPDRLVDDGLLVRTNLGADGSRYEV